MSLIEIMSKQNTIVRTFNSRDQYHSYDDQPALVHLCGNKYWMYNDKYHRIGLPAVIANGYVMYYEHGVLHRDGDLPAVIHKDNEYYYKRGLLHRDNDLPAVITDKFQYWYKNGMLHRIGEPARIFTLANGKVIVEYWENGEYIK